MTLGQARNILRSQRLKFGDSTHLEAIQVVAVGDLAMRLAEQKRSATCARCEGSGEVECEYGHSHECPYCEGKRSEPHVPKEWQIMGMTKEELDTFVKRMQEAER